MRKNKNRQQTYNYECSITGESYQTTRKVSNPEELMSVTAFYELHPNEDDRPEVIKQKVKIEREKEILEQNKRASALEYQANLEESFLGKEETKTTKAPPKKHIPFKRR